MAVFWYSAPWRPYPRHLLQASHNNAPCFCRQNSILKQDKRCSVALFGPVDLTYLSRQMQDLCSRPARLNGLPIRGHLLLLAFTTDMQRQDEYV